MHRIGELFSRLGAGNSNNSSSTSYEENITMPTSSSQSHTYQPNLMFGHQTDDSDLKRRAISTDSSGYHFDAASFGPATAAGSQVSRSRSIVVNSSVEDYVKRTKKTATYLKLLLHSKKCGGQCKMPNCLYTSRILKHVMVCPAQQQSCGIPGCHTTKKLLKHYEECGGKERAKVCKHDCGNDACDAMHKNQRKSFSAFSYSPPSPFLYHKQQQQELQQEEPLSERRGESTGLDLEQQQSQSTFCLLCSLVATTGPVDPPPQSPTSTDERPSLSDHGIHTAAVRTGNEKGNSGDSTSSLIIFDEIMDYNKVPFQNSRDTVSMGGSTSPYQFEMPFTAATGCNSNYNSSSSDSVLSSTTVVGAGFSVVDTRDTRLLFNSGLPEDKIIGQQNRRCFSADAISAAAGSSSSSLHILFNSNIASNDDFPANNGAISPNSSSDMPETHSEGNCNNGSTSDGSSDPDADDVMDVDTVTLTTRIDTATTTAGFKFSYSGISDHDNGSSSRPSSLRRKIRAKSLPSAIV